MTKTTLVDNISDDGTRQRVNVRLHRRKVDRLECQERKVRGYLGGQHFLAAEWNEEWKACRRRLRCRPRTLQVDINRSMAIQPLTSVSMYELYDRHHPRGVDGRLITRTLLHVEHLLQVHLCSTLLHHLNLPLLSHRQARMHPPSQEEQLLCVRY